MTTFAGGKVYEKLGVRPFVNAIGNSTVLGGSTTTAAIKEAMEDASQRFVGMEEPLARRATSSPIFWVRRRRTQPPVARPR